MTDRNNAPAGRLVPEVRVPTEKELREQNHPERDGKPMLLSSKQLMDRLDKEDSDCVYMALDARCAAERLQRVLQTITEQEE